MDNRGNTIKYKLIVRFSLIQPSYRLGVVRLRILERISLVEIQTLAKNILKLFSRILKPLWNEDTEAPVAQEPHSGRTAYHANLSIYHLYHNSTCRNEYADDVVGIVHIVFTRRGPKSELTKKLRPYNDNHPSKFYISK